jgi:ABC-2 type transport system permease protein
MELFSVAPLTAPETLIGKYLSYILFNALIGALLTGLVIWIMGIPMLGNWVDYALVLAVLLFTSLGVGFVISLISETEIQAVQYSMLFLLMSIFFSGFFLDLRLLREPMPILAWALPATYGIRMLQDIVLRGHSIPLLLFAGLAGIGLGLFLINLLLLKSKMEKN